MLTIYKLSILENGLNCVCLTNPLSITYPIPSIVKLVSAMFVANTTFLWFSGVLIKALAYYYGLWVPYNAKIIKGAISFSPF